jgi:hypothetical protein
MVSTSSTQPTPSAVAVIERPSSDHPAYWPLFDHYRKTGQSATRALALLAGEWDVELLGPLPSERTARHWAQVDAWDDKIREAVDANWEQYHRRVGTQLQTAAPLAVRTLEQVLSGEYPEPKMASAAVRAALAILDMVGFRKDILSPEAIGGAATRGVQGQAIALIKGMTPEQILQRRRLALAAQEPETV